jgi:nitrogen regulatory protein P-II 1
MKLVTAIIKPLRLEFIRSALVEIGVPGMTVSEANGFGRQRGITEVYRGARYPVDLVPFLTVRIFISTVQSHL